VPDTSLHRIRFRPAVEEPLTFYAAVRHGDLLYVSGCVSWDANGALVGAGDMKVQARNVYGELRTILESNGSSIHHVIKENCYTLDMEAALAHAVPVRAEFYSDGIGPAATWVQVAKLALEGALLEVEVIAAVSRER
jgi:2-iminobutanoate/2-iminopropanoate deaminase